MYLRFGAFVTAVLSTVLGVTTALGGPSATFRVIAPINFCRMLY